LYQSEGWARRPLCRIAALALVLVPGVASALAEATDPALASTRLRHPEDRVAVVQAIRGAARRLGDPRCRTLLTTFTDGDGKSLGQVLDAQGLAASEFLGRLFFYDGEASHCGGRHLAYTQPGSHVVFVCGRKFRALWSQSPDAAEAAIIHEALHGLGLGENPPTWEEITARVVDACRN
jgi:hypothetical protein